MKTELHSPRHPAFARVSHRDWKDWRWQLRNRIRDLEGLERLFDLTADERAAVVRLGTRLPIGLTPYYAGRVLVSPALRKTKIPATAEFTVAPGEHEDPLGEEAHHVVPWYLGGPTALWNLVLLCHSHHGLVEPAKYCLRDQWEVRIGADHLPEFFPPSRHPQAGLWLRHARHQQPERTAA